MSKTNFGKFLLEKKPKSSEDADQLAIKKDDDFEVVRMQLDAFRVSILNEKGL